MRKLIRVVLLAAGAVLLGALALWLYADALAKAGIEHGTAYALGVPATVHDVDLGLLAGTLRVDRLTVANPEGFKTPHLVSVRRLDLAVVPPRRPTDPPAEGPAP